MATVWDNDLIPEGTTECPDCGSFLDSEGYGSNCDGFHESECDTCLGSFCDGSC